MTTPDTLPFSLASPDLGGPDYLSQVLHAVLVVTFCITVLVRFILLVTAHFIDSAIGILRLWFCTSSIPWDQVICI